MFAEVNGTIIGAYALAIVSIIGAVSALWLAVRKGAITEYVDVIAELKKRIQELQTELAAMRTELSALRTQISTRDTEGVQQRGEIKALEKEVQETKKPDTAAIADAVVDAIDKKKEGAP